MKLMKIFRFELVNQASNISTWLYLAVLVGFTLIMNVLTTPGDGVYANNTLHITSISVIGGFIWLVMSAAIAGEAAARDPQTKMHPITYTSPVTKVDYLGGRFLAAFTANALLTLSLPLGVLISFYLPGGDEGGLLPFRPSAYLSVYFLIALPNTFVATALQFMFAALSRQVMTSYFASLVIAIFPQLIAVTLANLLGNWELIKLLDPVGVAGIIGGEMQTWTPSDKNTRLVTLTGMFFWNRILWMSIGFGALLYTYARFRFDPSMVKSWWSKITTKRKRASEKSEETVASATSSVVAPSVQRTFDAETFLFQTLRIARASFAKIAGNPIGLTLVLVIALVSAVFGDRIISQLGIPLLPTTQQVLSYLVAPVGNIVTPWVVIPLLIMYFSGALVWSERDAGMRDIADAAPVTEWALFTGKFFGLSLVIMAWLAILMTAGILMQIGLGYTDFQPLLYLSTLFGLQLINYLLFALLALTVHVVVNQKHLGYLVMLLVFIFMAFPSTFRVEHPMLIFGADPGWWYTDMRGFGNTIWPWLCFKIYWIAWALLLAVVARMLWGRGREQSVKDRLKVAQRSFTRATAMVTISALALLITSGGFIFYNTNVLNEYVTASAIYQRKAEYELRYGRYRNIPQPALTSTKLNVELYPDQQRVVIGGLYTLVNNDSVQIDSIHFGAIPGVIIREVEFNRKAAEVVKNNELSHFIYALAEPLLPGDSLQLNFMVDHAQKGFVHSGANELVVENGTYFTNYDLLPAIGYQPQREINDAVTRKQYKLASRPSLPSLYDEKARSKPTGTAQNTLEVTVSTSNNETAVAPGILLRTWTEGNRNYFHYKTDGPVGNEFAILSSDYQVRTDDWNGVAIRIYYHAAHATNIDRMIRSVKASLDHFTKEFGPYPYKHFTIVERAGLTGGASADASMINYGEQYSLMTPDDSPDGFDLPFYILAHEVGHQWWGVCRLTPANVEGAGVLIEGLAVYSGMQVLKESYGNSHLQKYVSYLHSSYETPRSLATASLLHANESFLYYRKGGLTMHALSQYIGTKRVNNALSSLLEKRTAGKLLRPTMLDLYSEIKQVTPDSLHYFLKDFFETNTYWRLKTKRIDAVQNPSGSWDVALQIQSQKVVIDSTGAEHDVPMNDWLEVGIFEQGSADPLYLKMHRIQSGEQTIKVTVPRKPERGGIDPNNLTIDIRRDDNVMYLEN